MDDIDKKISELEAWCGYLEDMIVIHKEMIENLLIMSKSSLSVIDFNDRVTRIRNMYSEEYNRICGDE